METLPVRAIDGVPVHPRPTEPGAPATLPVLRELARRRGWTEEDTGTGLPRFGIPAGGVVSYEPGGQIEYASPALVHLPTLDQGLADVLLPMADAMSEAGIHLLARGVDPMNAVEDATLVLRGGRYPRQREHYDRRGPLGRIMMTQSAALHVNVDLGSHPRETWSAANRLAPLLLALFANSPRRCGARRPHRSQRAALWRGLDPGRTGVFATRPGEDPAEAYLRFALDAEAFLLGPEGRPARPFRSWWEEGVGLDDARTHLTTLFPEIRPRGYLEVRSIDALPARWTAVAGALVTGLLHGPEARERVLREIPPASEARMDRAGRAGVTDPELRAEILGLLDPAQAGLRALGPAVGGAEMAERITRFFEEFPARGRDPGDAPDSRIDS